MPSAMHIEILERTRIRFGYRIAVLTNWYKAYPYRMFERKYGLAESEAASLYCLGQAAGLNATDICEITGRPKNSISRAISLLIEKKFVTRRTDIRDKRRKILDLTDRGYKVYRESVEWFVATETAMLSALTPDEIAALDVMLRKMIQHTPNWIGTFK
jgi:DNA-binding MarR family transcriptional regulator